MKEFVKQQRWTQYRSQPEAEREESLDKQPSSFWVLHRNDRTRTRSLFIGFVRKQKLARAPLLFRCKKIRNVARRYQVRAGHAVVGERRPIYPFHTTYNVHHI